MNTRPGTLTTLLHGIQR